MSGPTRAQVLKEAKRRLMTLELGDAVTNICAGDANPRRHARFVRMIIKSRTNRFGVTHREVFAECTDGRGKFWQTDPEVIYPGHLSSEECEGLFEPVWGAKFGNRKAGGAA